MSEKLKPCPFCGSTRVYVGDPLPGVDMPACLCLDCGGTIHHCYSDKDEAIAAWNRRSEYTDEASQAAQQELNSQAVELLADLNELLKSVDKLHAEYLAMLKEA